MTRAVHVDGRAPSSVPDGSTNVAQPRFLAPVFALRSVAHQLLGEHVRDQAFANDDLLTSPHE